MTAGLAVVTGGFLGAAVSDQDVDGKMIGVAPIWWTPKNLGERSPPEYRARMVELVRAGRTPEELGREFEPTAQSIRSWVHQANRAEGRRADGLTSTEREELSRLRRENRQLKLEREILAKATAWFARETGSVPGKSSSS